MSLRQRQNAQPLFQTAVVSKQQFHANGRNHFLCLKQQFLGAHTLHSHAHKIETNGKTVCLLFLAFLYVALLISSLQFVFFL
jgi:hypothetical protein